MKGFKNLKFHSVIPQDILQAVELLEKLGYEVGDDFSSDDAARHNGICAWDDGEITEGWLDTYSGLKQVTLEDLKEMVGEIKNTQLVLWLNKNTLEEKYLESGSVIKGIDWINVPDGATFATGDKDNFVFRKDGWYYDNQKGEWVETNVLLKDFPEYKYIKLFWVRSDVKDNVFTLERLLGCEVLFGDTLYHVNYIYYAGTVGHLVLETDTRRAYVSDFNLLTFFTEDGDELTFDEYVQLYYPKG